MADFDSVIHLGVARDRARRRKQLKVGNTGTSGYRAPEVRGDMWNATASASASWSSSVCMVHVCSLGFDSTLLCLPPPYTGVL